MQLLARCIGDRNECQEHYGNLSVSVSGVGPVEFGPAVRGLRYRTRRKSPTDAVDMGMRLATCRR
jgi:hypothetical protein